MKKLTGSGGPRLGKPPKASTKDGGSTPRVGLYQPPPPFIGNWPDETIGMGTIKKKTKESKKKKKSRERVYCLVQTVRSIKSHCWAQYCKTKVPQKYTNE